MNKTEIYNFLDNLNIPYEVTEHQAVFNMNDASGVELPYPEGDAKNLFIRDDKKRAYYLITVRGDKRMDLKAFREKYSTRPLGFASERDLSAILDLYPGAVSPFGLLNDRDLKVQWYVDPEFLQNRGMIGIHPNDNTATVWLHIEDLVKIIEDHGNVVRRLEI